MGEKISVIVPVYNRENLIEKCIKSVISQLEVSLELLLIDDGSTDRSLEICRKYESEYDNVRVFTHENSGLSVSRNVGLDNATGDYICFLDDDDVMTPGSFKFMLDAMKTYDVDMVVGNYERYRENGEFRSSSYMPDNVKNRVITVDEYWEASFDKKGYLVFIVSWAKLYKKNIWEDLRYPDEFRKAEDEYVLSDILDKCKSIYVTDHVVHNQTTTQTSITRTGGELNLSTLRVPESKLVTTSKLMKKHKYNFAGRKWSIACGEIIVYTRQAKDIEILNELKRIYKISVDQGKVLFRYLNIKKKMKFIAYAILYPIMQIISSIKSGDTNK